MAVTEMSAGEVAAVGQGGMLYEADKAGNIAEAAKDVSRLPVSKQPTDKQFIILSGWLKADADFSRDWRAATRVWFAFRAGEQWTAEDKAMLESQSRPAVVFNRVLTILKAVAGFEINGRHDVAFLPRGTEDTAVNEVLSAASKWMSDGCDGEDEESEAFDSTATCGMGWVENRMSYEEDPAGLYVEDCVDALEMYWDRASRKRNLSNAKRMARVRKMPLGEAMDMFPGFTRDQLDAVWAVDGGMEYPQKTIEDKWRRDTANSDLANYDDLCEVTIVQIQWIEKECYYLVADPFTNQRIELTEQEYAKLKVRMAPFGGLTAAKMTRKLYKQAFLGAQGTMLRPAGPSPIAGRFSWECITGELDKSTGTWFGLVKVMRDPQMWANKWVSQILHILNTTAKGGIMAERSAFDDEREAEDSYAMPDEITWLADGALSGAQPKVIPKPGGAMTEGYVGLLAFAISSIKDVTGINLELLGQQDQNQPGVLEMMRKQAGMTVLATLFDSLRRFRKGVGRSRLYFIQNFLSDGRLIRVAGPEGPEAVRLAKDKTTGEYDVVVADAPTSPNQKEQNWQIIQPLLGVFKEQLMAQPEILAMLLEYSPLPSRIVDAIKKFITEAKNNPEAQQMRQITQRLSIESLQARNEKDQSAAVLNRAKALATMADSEYNMAMAQNLLQDNIREGNFEEARKLLAAIEAAAKADRDTADADLMRAQAERERTGGLVDVIDAKSRNSAEREVSGRERVGRVIDAMVGSAQADKHRAGAEKDRALAHRARVEPVTKGA